MKKHLRLLISLAVPALVLLLAACGAQSGDNTYTGSTYAASPTATTSTTAASPTAATSGGAAIKTESVTVNGKTVTALTDSKGFTLYYFTPDNTATTSQCTGSCAAAWPPVLSPNGAPTSAASLPGKLGTQSNANGVQVTYNGHLLYTFASDTAAGQTNGEGVGGKWHVVTTDLAPTTLGS